MDRSPTETPTSFSRLTAPRTTIVPALVGSIACWLAFPPVGWSYLAWIGPVPWMLLVAQPTLPGRRPYRALWLAGFVFWMLTVHWIRLPHPANYLSWTALAAYLGAYLPVFVALARVGVIRWGLPLVLVAPVVWTGLEWFRAHLLTGFLMGSLAHTQVYHLDIIQIADLAGEYGVTFLIVLVAAAIAKTVSLVSEPCRPRPRPIIAAVLPAVIALSLTAFYGQNHIARISKQAPHSHIRIALIQGNSLADWKSDAARQQQIMDEYVRLSREAVRNNPDIDLLIWPETAFRETLITVEPGYTPTADRVSPENLNAAQNYLKLLTKELGAAVLVGIDRVDVYPNAQGELAYRSYNSAVLLDAEGNVVGTYDKMHRVPFGEFIPLADWFPGLYKLTPLTGGIAAGENPEGMGLKNLRLSTNICYETAVPHLIHWRMLGKVTPDLLVNLTNDAWFWGSSELDMHLACGVFRAVENRVPLVIAANGGLSAYVDLTGEVIAVSHRQVPEVLKVDVLLRRSQVGSSCYSRYGDWFALVCVACCVVLAVVGWRSRQARSAVAGKGTAR